MTVLGLGRRVAVDGVKLKPLACEQHDPVPARAQHARAALRVAQREGDALAIDVGAGAQFAAGDADAIAVAVRDHADVQDALAPAKKLAYTSAATILRILEQKGFVTSTKLGKTFIYQATLSKDTYQSRSLKNLSEKLFDNTPAALVARLVDDYDLTEETLGEIRALIDKRLRDDKR